MTGGGQRVLIAGAGVTGLLAAVRCVLAGHRVTVLDRGAIPNPQSSSFDQHRALRALDPDDPEGTLRVAGAHRRWLELETLLGGEFYRRVGVVTAWPADEIGRVAAVAADAGLRFELVEPEKLPHLQFPAGSTALLELDAGVLLADRVLRAAARWLDRHPAATLLPGREVTRVDADSGRIVLAGGESLGADLVLIATGPWSRDLVDLPMVLHRQTMVYLRPPEELARWWENAPSTGRIGADGRAWLLPPGRGTLLKLSSATVCREVDTVLDVDAVSEDDDGKRWADRLMEESILTGADRYHVAAVKQCHYLVDAGTGAGRLARMGPTVWARAASGGDGFRTAPLVAEQVAAAVAAGIGRQAYEPQ